MRISWRLSICFALVCSSCARRPSLPPSVIWDEKSSVFHWPGGEVRLPGRFIYQRDVSDTIMGHFTSPDGKLVIHHDIGGYAGAWANRRLADSFDERIVERVRVWTDQQKWPDGHGGRTMLAAVTLPDNGCANFYLTSSNIEDAALIDSIARSFHPKRRSNPGLMCGPDRNRK
jgi:hypothetical protein